MTLRWLIPRLVLLVVAGMGMRWIHTPPDVALPIIGAFTLLLVVYP